MPWSPGRFLCTTSSTLRELPVAGVNLLSAQDARIEIGGGGAQIRGSGSSGLAAQPQSRRCSECCDSIHPPAGHIYQCVPSFERAEYEIAESWQLGEQRTGGAAIQRTGGAANRGSQHKRSNEPRGVPFTFCMFAAREIVSLLALVGIENTAGVVVGSLRGLLRATTKAVKQSNTTSSACLFSVVEEVHK